MLRRDGVHALAYLLCLLFSAASFFKVQLLSGFTMLFGDNNDGIIEVAILEHWWNVWGGHAPWQTTFYFHPYKGTLGFNDGFFLHGAAYAVFRRLGADPFLASELVNVAWRAVAFAGFQVFLRRSLGLGRGWSLLGAVVFTTSCTMAMRANHAQLLSVGLVPVWGWLAWNAVSALGRGAPRAVAGWGGTAALLMAAWLMTSYYMAWFTLFFLLCATLLALLSRPRAALALLRRLTWWDGVALAGVAAVFGLGITPFLRLYLPKARATGMHSAEEALAYAIQPLDLLHVGRGNLLFSWLDAWLGATFRPGLPGYSEHTTGLTPVLLLVFLTACAALLTRRWVPPGGPLVPLLAATAVLTWFVAVDFGGRSAWAAVLQLVPGAKGLRVVVRYQLFLAAPVIAVAAAFLARRGARPLPAAALALLLVAEQATVQQPASLDRPAELAQLRAMPAPPAGCRVFFVSRAEAASHGTPEVNATYSHNVDAMLLAEILRLPTLNGFGTFNPADWDFVGPDRPDYLARVRTYVQAHGLRDVCAADLRERRWSASPFEAPEG